MGFSGLTPLPSIFAMRFYCLLRFFAALNVLCLHLTPYTETHALHECAWLHMQSYCSVSWTVRLNPWTAIWDQWNRVSRRCDTHSAYSMLVPLAVLDDVMLGLDLTGLYTYKHMYSIYKWRLNSTKPPKQIGDLWTHTHTHAHINAHRLTQSIIYIRFLLSSVSSPNIQHPIIFIQVYNMAIINWHFYYHSYIRYRFYVYVCDYKGGIKSPSRILDAAGDSVRAPWKGSLFHQIKHINICNKWQASNSTLHEQPSKALYSAIFWQKVFGIEHLWRVEKWEVML